MSSLKLKISIYTIYISVQLCNFFQDSRRGKPGKHFRPLEGLANQRVKLHLKKFYSLEIK